MKAIAFIHGIPYLDSGDRNPMVCASLTTLSDSLSGRRLRQEEEDARQGEEEDDRHGEEDDRQEEEERQGEEDERASGVEAKIRSDVVGRVSSFVGDAASLLHEI